MSTDYRQQVENENLATLACAVELGSRVLLEVAGNEMSNRADGQELTLPYLQTALAARIKAAVAPQLMSAGG